MPALSHASLLDFGALSHFLVRLFFFAFVTVAGAVSHFLVSCLACAVVLLVYRDPCYTKQARACGRPLCCADLPARLFFFAFVPVAGAVCPHCFGNLAGCDYDNDSTSCPYVKATTANVAAIAAAAGTTSLLTLSGVLAPRFLKAFTASMLSAILRLARRTAVTAFEVKATSKIDEIMHAITTGAIPYEDALVALGGLADSEADATRAAVLWRRYDMLSKAKEVGKLALTTTALEDTGVFSWLWAKTSEHVATRAIDTSVSVEVGPPGPPPTSHSGATQNLLVSHLKVFKSEWDFMECCNLFLMYCTTLGLASVLTLTSFYEYFVFDTLRRGYSWQLVSCMLYVVFRLCEESGGLVTLANAHEKLHLNSVYQEAEIAMNRLYPGAGIFRAHPGKGGNTTQPGGAGDRTWNGKSNASSSKICSHFNFNRDHPATALQPDGTCKARHVCDAWVDNKGKGGRCLGSAGTAGHGRHNCDNPHRCDSPVQ